MSTNSPKRLGIIGHPLGHTLSPALHNWGLRTLGMDGHYGVWPTQPQELAPFVERVRAERIHGVSVTIPHKQAVIPLLDGLSPRARAVGAVNTLLWDKNALTGDNTDMAGVSAPVLEAVGVPQSALVLGAGGAARAAAAALAQLGTARLMIANRTREKAEAMADDFGMVVVDWGERHEAAPQLLVNTTPLGMSGAMEQLSPWEAARLGPGMTVFDLVYNPLRTRLIREAETAGARTILGLEMFVHQGLEQFLLWTGRDLDPAAARKLLLAKLDT